MTTIKQLERLRKIHFLIKAGKTGNPKEFSQKLKISESHLYHTLEDLKIKGFPISYSRKSKSYYYFDDCDLEFIFSVKLITSDDKIKIFGGLVKNHFTPIRLEWSTIY